MLFHEEDEGKPIRYRQLKFHKLAVVAIKVMQACMKNQKLRYCVYNVKVS